MPTIENICFVKHADIDKQKWDDTILNSLDGRIYATSIWLDHLSANWDALVLGDYEIVMPLPSKKKWGIKYLAQPAFTQQLGVFSVNKINLGHIGQFFIEALKKFRFGEIFTNVYPTDIFQKKINISKNYTLDLSQDYKTIRSNYSNELLKRNLKQKPNLVYIKSNNVELAIKSYQALYADRTPHISVGHFKAFENLTSKLALQNKAFTRCVINSANNDLLAISLFLKDEKRIYNIAPSTFPDGRTLHANHFLLDELIKEFAGQNLLLDFEGSDLPGVERFYKKFGSLLEPYYFIKWNNLPKLVKLFKK
jgi:hypothetical protein